VIVPNAMVRKSSDLLEFLAKNIMQHYFHPSAKLLLYRQALSQVGIREQCSSILL